MSKIIELLDYDGLGLIVKYPTGIIYTNQVAGYGCFHPNVEGFFVPLPVKRGKHELFAFKSHFNGNWRNISEEDFTFINKVLKKNLRYIQVDHELVSESYEAWIHVVIQNYDNSPIQGYDVTKGILTWQNSD
mgnify:CR=1 FL=1